MPDSHCPTKTLSVHGDIWPDQPDVPAVCHLWHQAKARTWNLQNVMHYTKVPKSNQG